MLSEQLLNNTSTTRVELESAPTRTARRASLTVHSREKHNVGQCWDKQPGTRPPENCALTDRPRSRIRLSDDQGTRRVTAPVGTARAAALARIIARGTAAPITREPLRDIRRGSIAQL